MNNSYIKYLNMLKKIFFLPPLPTVLIALPCFALVIYSLIWGQDKPVLAYISYVLSAYALVISCTAIYRLIRFSKTGLKSNPFWIRYNKDMEFRTKITLLPGVIINMAYVAIKLISGIYLRSFWFIALAVYYFFLFIMRFSLFRHVHKNAVGTELIAELKKTRLCGILLIIMDLALATIVFFMVYWERGYHYPGILIYVMAMYAFYAITIAIYNLIKYRKFGSPLILTTKALSLTAALVSILALETAMLSQFGTSESPLFKRLMTGLTGAGICIIVLGMAGFMIVRSGKRLKQHAQGDFYE